MPIKCIPGAGKTVIYSPVFLFLFPALDPRSNWYGTHRGHRVSANDRVDISQRCKSEDDKRAMLNARGQKNNHI